ncbi:MAG TPA: heme exporter protein CcmD [Crenotrichaceae bacterium]|nr:heme exporter protein CcmD [Crenotrichaceae bacterium]
MNEFFNMSGYASYVWGSFGLAFVMLVWQIVQPLMEKKAIIESILKNQLRRRQRQ